MGQTIGAVEEAMRTSWRHIPVAALAITLAAVNLTQAAEIKAFVTGAARGAFEILAPQFERATGHKITSQFGLPPTLVAKIDAGEPFDVIIKFIATSGEGSSGRYVLTLLDRLGIADQVKPKIKSGGPGRSAELVAAGEVDFVVSGLPPLIGRPNVEWLGLIPSEINSFVVFTAGLSAAAKEADAGRALLRFLGTPEAMSVYKSKGLDPP